jgi:hypothetical protein
MRVGLVRRVSDRQLAKYLLGLLPPAAVERIDEASIANEDVAARLERIEEDLIDSYVRGALDGGTLARFKSHYLSTPRRRARVAFAAQLARAVDRAQEPKRPRRPPRGWIVPLLAVAAALLVVAVAFDAPLADFLERSARKTPPVALVLEPLVRSIGATPTLRIPPAAEVVGIDLRLARDPSGRYQVAITDPAANGLVWQSEWTSSFSSAGNAWISIAVPARVLRSEHVIEVDARAPDEPDAIASYAFRVVKR